MTITLGRVGAAAADGGDGATLADPHTVTRQGRSLTLTGLHTAATQEALMWRARQLLGLVDGDEPVVPCTFSAEPRLDGYYRVVDAQVVHEQGSTRDDGYLMWQVQLEEITSFRQPRIEMHTAYAVLINGDSVSSYDALIGVPGPVVDIDPIFTADTNGTRPVAEGSSILWVADTGTSDLLTTGYSTFTCPAASYYHGGCRIEHDIGSSTFRQAVGRPDFPSAGSTGSDSQVTRIGNGLVRLVLTYSNATVSDFSVEWWDGSAWVATEFYIEGVTSHDELTWHSVEVLRNTAEFCSLRIRAIPGSVAVGATHVDVSVRRGIRWLTVIATSAVAPSGGWRVGFRASTACTVVNNAIHRTSNNGNGDREIIYSKSAATDDTTNGRSTIGAVKTGVFAFGLELGGTGASGQDTLANQLDEKNCALSETAQVVAN